MKRCAKRPSAPEANPHDCADHDSGLVPLAIGHGAGSELQQPLAITVIGGLATATFLTLFVVPIVYELMDELAQRLSRKGGTVIEG